MSQEAVKYSAKTLAAAPTTAPAPKSGRSLGTIAAEIVGLTVIIHWIFSLMFNTIAEHSFMVKAINRLYTTRTVDDTLIGYI